ncbi:MAG: glycerol-3-phosphate 1-O-acyltransferase PlsY [Bacillota bacterium]
MILIGYVVGSIPFGYLAGRLRGIDLMAVGSGNIGATNVLRTLGVTWAVPVLVLDAAKGVLSAYAGTVLLPGMPQWGAVAGAGAALAGHTWSVFLRFRGGKSAATGAGALLYLMPRVVAVTLLAFTVTVAVTRYVSLGSIVGATVAVTAALVTPNPLPFRLLVVAGGILIVVRHRSNIARLLAGTENRLGQKAGRS